MQNTQQRKKYKSVTPPRLKDHALNLFSNIFSNILANKIISLLGATGIVALVAIRLYLVEQVWTPTIELLTTPIVPTQFPITALSVSVQIVLFGAFFYLGFNVQKYYWKKKKYFFTAIGDLKWKTDKITRETPQIPYCRLHELRLNEYKDGYWCPISECKAGRKISSMTITVAYLSALSIAEAKLDKHLKRNIFRTIKSWLKYQRKIKIYKPNKTINSDA